jgi:hypothetical protein
LSQLRETAAEPMEYEPNYQKYHEDFLVSEDEPGKGKRRKSTADYDSEGLASECLRASSNDDESVISM